MVLAMVIGDLHFKKDTPHVTDLVIHKLMEKIDKYKPNLVVLLGDILDTHEKIEMKVQNKAIRFIKGIAKKGITVVVIIGNHDRPDGTTFLTEDSSLFCLKDIPNIYVADRVLDLKWEVGPNKEKIRFIFVPYVQPGSFHEALDTLETKVLDKNHPVSAIFCHQEFKGVKIGGYVSKGGDDWPETNPLVISGHIHTMQQPQGNMVYPGTPNQQSWSDTTDKGILICEFLPGQPQSINFVQLDIRKKKIVKIKPSEVDSYVPPADCDVQVDIEGTADEIKVLSSKGIISQMRSRGVNVSLTTKRDFNPKNPENKAYRELLIQMIKDDSEAMEIFNEIFSPEPGATMILPSTSSLSDLMKSSQNVAASKISTDPSQLLNAIMAQARTSGNIHGDPLAGQNSVQSFFAGFGAANSQTERAPVAPTGMAVPASAPLQTFSVPLNYGQPNPAMFPQAIPQGAYGQQFQPAQNSNTFPSATTLSSLLGQPQQNPQLGVPTTPAALRLPGTQDLGTSSYGLGLGLGMAAPSTSLSSQMAASSLFSPPGVPVFGSGASASFTQGNSQILGARLPKAEPISSLDLIASLKNSAVDEKARGVANSLESYLTPPK